MKGKGAALTHFAFEGDFTPEEPSNFAAYGEPQASAPVSAAGGTVRLLKGLEHDGVFLRRNANAGIDHAKCDHIGRATKCRMVETPAGGGQPDLEHHRPAICKFAS